MIISRNYVKIVNTVSYLLIATLFVIMLLGTYVYFESSIIANKVTAIQLIPIYALLLQYAIACYYILETSNKLIRQYKDVENGMIYQIGDFIKYYKEKRIKNCRYNKYLLRAEQQLKSLVSLEKYNLNGINTLKICRIYGKICRNLTKCDEIIDTTIKNRDTDA